MVHVDRDAAIRRGINGTNSPVLVSLDVAAISPEDRGRLIVWPRD